MATKHYGAIAILDALGIKGIWQRQNAKDVVDKWDSLMDIYQRVHEKRTKENDGYVSKFYAFSDTVIITAVGKDIVNTLTTFGVDLGILFIQSALNGFFFRGCVSVGDLYIGEKTIIGPPVDEAAQYYTLPQWVGISLSPSAYNILRKSNPKQILEFGYGDVYLPYKIPTKLGLENGFAINLPLAYLSTKDTFTMELNLKAPELLDELFESELDKVSDIEASLKIRNTLDFIKHAEEINKQYRT